MEAIPQPNNAVDNYAVCVLKDGEVVGHLKRGKLGRFAKTIFYFLEADQHSSCSVIIKADKAVNFGDGEGMQVQCNAAVNCNPHPLSSGNCGDMDFQCCHDLKFPNPLEHSSL